VHAGGPVMGSTFNVETETGHADLGEAAAGMQQQLQQDYDERRPYDNKQKVVGRSEFEKLDRGELAQQIAQRAGERGVAAEQEKFTKARQKKAAEVKQHQAEFRKRDNANRIRVQEEARTQRLAKTMNTGVQEELVAEGSGGQKITEEQMLASRGLETE
jgi:hypothetical protein